MTVSANLQMTVYMLTWGGFLKRCKKHTISCEMPDLYLSKILQLVECFLHIVWKHVNWLRFHDISVTFRDVPRHICSPFLSPLMVVFQISNVFQFLSTLACVVNSPIQQAVGKPPVHKQKKKQLPHLFAVQCGSAPVMRMLFITLGTPTLTIWPAFLLQHLWSMAIFFGLNVKVGWYCSRALPCLG